MKPSEVANLTDPALVRMTAEILRRVYAEKSIFWSLYQDIAVRLDSVAKTLEEQEASQLTADEPLDRFGKMA